MTTAGRTDAANDAPAAAMGRYRWVVVALLFTAMIINYVDRQALGLLKADLTSEFTRDLLIVAAFIVAAVGLGAATLKRRTA